MARDRRNRGWLCADAAVVQPCYGGVAQVIRPAPAGRESGVRATRSEDRTIPIFKRDYSLWARRISRISRLMRAASREAFSTMESHFLSVSFNSACASKYEACMMVSSELLRSCARERNCLLAVSGIFASPATAANPSPDDVLFVLCDFEGAGIKELLRMSLTTGAAG